MYPVSLQGFHIAKLAARLRGALPPPAQPAGSVQGSKSLTGPPRDVFFGATREKRQPIIPIRESQSDWQNLLSYLQTNRELHPFCGWNNLLIAVRNILNPPERQEERPDFPDHPSGINIAALCRFLMSRNLTKGDVHRDYGRVIGDFRGLNDADLAQVEMDLVSLINQDYASIPVAQPPKAVPPDTPPSSPSRRPIEPSDPVTEFPRLAMPALKASTEWDKVNRRIRPPKSGVRRKAQDEQAELKILVEFALGNFFFQEKTGLHAVGLVAFLIKEGLFKEPLKGQNLQEQVKSFGLSIPEGQTEGELYAHTVKQIQAVLNNGYQEATRDRWSDFAKGIRDTLHLDSVSARDLKYLYPYLDIQDNHRTALDTYYGLNGSSARYGDINSLQDAFEDVWAHLDASFTSVSIQPVAGPSFIKPTEHESNDRDAKVPVAPSPPEPNPDPKVQTEQRREDGDDIESVGRESDGGVTQESTSADEPKPPTRTAPKTLPLGDEVKGYLRSIYPIPLLNAEDEVRLAKTIEAAKLIGYCLREGISLNQLQVPGGDPLPFRRHQIEEKDEAGKVIKRSDRLFIIDCDAVANRLGIPLDLEKWQNGTEWTEVRESVHLNYIVLDGNTVSLGPHQEPDLTPEATRAVKALLEAGQKAETQMNISNLRWVVHLARRYPPLDGLELMDLIAAGNSGSARVDPNESDEEVVGGLSNAVRKFDWRKGFKLSTYSTAWIRQAITREIKNKQRPIRLPINAQEKIAELDTAERELAILHGRPPTDEELIDELKLDKKLRNGANVLNALRRAREQSFHSLDGVLGPGDPGFQDGDLTLADVTPDTKIGTDADASIRIKLAEVRACLPLLGKVGQILADYFYLDIPELWGNTRTLKELGKVYGVGHEMIRKHLASIKPILTDSDRSFVEKTRAFNLASLPFRRGRPGHLQQRFIRLLVQKMGTFPPSLTDQEIKNLTATYNLDNKGRRTREERLLETGLTLKQVQKMNTVSIRKLAVAAGEELVINSLIEAGFPEGELKEKIAEMDKALKEADLQVPVGLMARQDLLRVSKLGTSRRIPIKNYLDQFDHHEHRATFLRTLIERNGWPQVHSADTSKPDGTMIAGILENATRNRFMAHYSLYGGEPKSITEIATTAKVRVSSVRSDINKMLDALTEQTEPSELKEIFEQLWIQSYSIRKGYTLPNDAPWINLSGMLQVSIESITDGTYEGKLSEAARGQLPSASEMTPEAAYYAYFNAKRLGALPERVEAWFQVMFNPKGEDLLRGKSPGAAVAEKLGLEQDLTNIELDEIYLQAVDALLPHLPSNIQNINLAEIDTWGEPKKYSIRPVQIAEIDQVLSDIALDLGLSEDDSIIEELRGILSRPQTRDAKTSFKPTLRSRKTSSTGQQVYDLLHDLTTTPEGDDVVQKAQDKLEKEGRFLARHNKSAESGRQRRREVYDRFKQGDYAANTATPRQRTDLYNMLGYTLSVLGMVLHEKYPGHGFDEVDLLLRNEADIADVLALLRARLIKVGLIQKPPDEIDKVKLLLDSAEQKNGIPINIEFATVDDKARAIRMLCAEESLHGPLRDLIKDSFIRHQLIPQLYTRHSTGGTNHGRYAHLMDLSDLEVPEEYAELVEDFESYMIRGEKPEKSWFSDLRGEYVMMHRRLYSALDWSTDGNIKTSNLDTSNGIPLHIPFHSAEARRETFHNLLEKVKEDRSLQDELRSYFLESLKIENATRAHIRQSIVDETELSDLYVRYLDSFVRHYIEGQPNTLGSQRGEAMKAVTMVYNALGWTVFDDQHGADFYIPPHQTEEVYPLLIGFLNTFQHSDVGQKLVLQALDKVCKKPDANETIEVMGAESPREMLEELLTEDQAETPDNHKVLQILRMTLIALLVLLAESDPGKDYERILSQLRHGDYVNAIENLNTALLKTTQA